MGVHAGFAAVRAAVLVAVAVVAVVTHVSIIIAAGIVKHGAIGSVRVLVLSVHLIHVRVLRMVRIVILITVRIGVRALALRHVLSGLALQRRVGGAVAAILGILLPKPVLRRSGAVLRDSFLG